MIFPIRLWSSNHSLLNLQSMVMQFTCHLKFTVHCIPIYTIFFPSELDFTKIVHHTSPKNLNSFGTLKRAFPRMKQAVYPNERRPNVVHGQHLHFTRIPMHEEMFQEMRLIKGFHVTIWFEEGFKDFSRNEVKIAWFATLETEMLVTMGITLVVAWVAGCLSWWLLDPSWSLTMELCEFLYWLVISGGTLAKNVGTTCDKI